MSDSVEDILKGFDNQEKTKEKPKNEIKKKKEIIKKGDSDFIKSIKEKLEEKDFNNVSKPLIDKDLYRTLSSFKALSGISIGNIVSLSVSEFIENNKEEIKIMFKKGIKI